MTNTFVHVFKNTKVCLHHTLKDHNNAIKLFEYVQKAKKN